MTRVARGLLICLALLLAPAAILSSSFASAGEQDIERFERAWSRLDRPVASLHVERTWVWGPEPITGVLGPDSDLVPAGIERAVYYDKARMHFPAGAGDGQFADVPANGRLVAEMISGSVQLAVRQFTQHQPAAINVVGDASDPDGITYAALAELRTAEPFDEDAPLVTLLRPDGSTAIVDSLADHEVTASVLDGATNHRIASVFWEFLTSTGPVWADGNFVEEPLFPDPLALTGSPLTEAYWVEAQVGGVRDLVLLQCFESRCMTFTPSNPEAWQVEFNNAGAHYLDWRESFGGLPDPEPTAPEEPALPKATFHTAAGTTPTMTLEVAATRASRQCGLMHRTELPADQGMLFVYEEDTIGGFWNCNTFIPLTLAWIDADGTIIGLSDMDHQTPGQPQIPVSTYPPGPYRFVIEANRGWFAEHGVVPGDRVDLSDALARGDTSPNSLCLQLGLDCR